MTRSLVHPWVQRGHVDVPNFLTLLHFNQQCHGSRASAKERIPWVKWRHQIKPFEERLHVLVGFHPTILLTLPNFNHGVPVQK